MHKCSVNGCDNGGNINYQSKWVCWNCWARWIVAWKDMPGPIVVEQQLSLDFGSQQQYNLQ